MEFFREARLELNQLPGRKKKALPNSDQFFLIWIGLYILAHNFIITHFHYSLNDENLAATGLNEKANIVLRTHFTFFIIPLLLMSAFLLYAILARPKYNFVEILTLCSFGSGIYFMMLFVSDIIFGGIFRINILTANIFSWQSILSSLYNFWFAYDFFKRVHIRLFWLRLISVTFLITGFGWIILVYLPQAWIYFTG